MKKAQRFAIIILFILISYPYRFKVGSGTISIVDFYLVPIGLLIYLGVLGFLVRKENIKYDRVPVSIFTYVVFIIFTLMYSVSISSSVRHIFLIFEGLIIFLLITSYIKTYDDFRLICKYFTFVGVVSLVLSIVYFYFDINELQLYSITSEDMLRSIQLRLGSPAWGPSNYYASMLIMFIPLFITQFIDYRKKIWGLISVVALILMLQTWSRGGILALIITLTVYFASKRKSKKNRFLIMFTVLAIALSAYLFMKFNNELFKFFFIIKDDNSRFIILRDAFRLIKNRPLLGYGIGTTQILGEYLKTGTHNYYIQSILETGILGFFLFINMMVNFLKSSMPRKNYDLPTNSYKTALFSSLVGIFVNIMFQASFEGVVFVWLFWIFISLVYSIHRIEKQLIINKIQER